MKKIISSILVAACLMPAAASAKMNFSIDSKAIEFVNQPFMVNDTVMLPLREALESFYYSVTWNDATKQIELLRENTLATVKVDSDILAIDGEEFTMPQKVILSGGVSYIPLLAVEQLVKADVEWNYDKYNVAVALNERFKNAFHFDESLEGGEEIKLVSLLPNSDFEEGQEPWTPRYNTTTVAVETSNVHSGGGALAFSGQKGAAAGIHTSMAEILRAEGEGDYRLSFWAKTDSGAVSLDVYPAKINDSASSPYRSFTVGSEWQKYEFKATLTWGDIMSAPMIFFLDQGKHNGETVYIDDLMFVKE